MLGKRLELQKARQESDSALFLVKNGGVFRFCATLLQRILQRQRKYIDLWNYLM